MYLTGHKRICTIFTY